MVQYSFTSTETRRLVDGKPRTATSTLTQLLNSECIWRWEKRDIIYLALHCHHQNDSCIKMGSEENHSNVSINVRDKIIRQRPQITTFLKRKESRSGFQPRSLCLQSNTLPLGQTGSRYGLSSSCCVNY